MTLFDHLYLAPFDHRRKVPRATNSCDINQNTRVKRKDRRLWNREEDPGGPIVNEQRSVPRIDVGVIVSHHRPQVYGVAASAFLDRNTVRLPCGGEHAQIPRLDLRDLGAVNGNREEQTPCRPDSATAG